MSEETTMTVGDYEHEHVHAHADGTTHSHSHVHESGHDHDADGEHEHAHGHGYGGGHGHGHHHGHHHHHHGAEGVEVAGDEKLAMLRYMLGHNKDHAEELAGLSMGASAEAEAVLAQALDHFNQANALLEDYIRKVEAE